MTKPAIPSAIREQVVERAQGKCEYCLIHQDFSIYTQGKRTQLLTFEED